MSQAQTKNRPEPLRVSAQVVMDAAMLARAKAKAAEHKMSFPEFLERACRTYGKLLDKKITAIARPI